VGTRMAGVVSLYAFAKAHSKEITTIPGAEEFVLKALDDKNELLQEVAKR